LLSLGFGLAQVALVFCSLRRLFPAAVGKQVVGLVVAGFVPMQLYVTHYVTNESLAACLMSAALYFALRLGQEEHAPWQRYVALGLCLGLALLTKVTALILVPFVFAALVYQMTRREPPSTSAAKVPAPKQPIARHQCWTSPALAVVVCLAVCGWHYWRVWRHFGHAFFVPTRWAYGVSWWQDPGYHTAAYFTRFGQSLAAPFFSGLWSFGDGLYSTLWGDGLCGGAAGLLYRPPWNYELMAGGCLLALLPTLLIVAGLCAIVLKLVRRPEAVWLGLLGFAFAMLLGIMHLNLEVPAYAEAKALFGLAALIPLCAFAAAGWGLLGRKLSLVSMAAGIVLCGWALTSYASFWVQGDSAATHAAVGRGLMKDGNLLGALAQFEAALQADPRHIPARSSLIATLLQQQHLPEAAQTARVGVAAHPNEALCQLDLAAVLEKQGRLDKALEHTQLAVHLAADQPEARLRLASRLFQLHRQPEAIAACREALRLTPADPEVHFLLASALAAQAQRPDASLECSGGERLRCGPVDGWSPNEVLTGEAINHFQLVVKLAPDTPDALNHLAWILATYPRRELRDGHEAVRLAQRACVLTGNRNPAVLLTLAAAYAEAGQYGPAVESAGQAEKVAEAAGNRALQERSQTYQQLFRAQQPVRQALPGPT
jgi:tetratricopeptide (TPR) repeat protein